MLPRILMIAGIVLTCGVSMTLAFEKTARGSSATTTLQDDDGTNAPRNAIVAKRLSSLDPTERQHAAEELARVVAVDQQKIVAGYRLEEKDRRVRLALDWALYRMGKGEALFSVVRDLDSSRHSQASEYLSLLDSPQVLYPFLDRSNYQTKARLLKVLGHIGDAGSLQQVRSYTFSANRSVAEAATAADQEIQARLALPLQHPQGRPRRAQQTPASPTEP